MIAIAAERSIAVDVAGKRGDVRLPIAVAEIVFSSCKPTVNCDTILELEGNSLVCRRGFIRSGRNPDLIPGSCSGKGFLQRRK